MRDGIFMIEPLAVTVDGQSAGRSVVISLADWPQFVTGRRACVKYRELDCLRQALM